MYKFDAQKHIHTLNGKPLHGVTSVLKYWGDPNPLLNWGVKTACDFIEAGGSVEDARTAHLKVRDKAGNKGTDVHAELEIMMNNIMDKKLGDKYSPIVIKVLGWMSEENITPLASEMSVWSEAYWYGGIADGVIEKEGKKYILDFKTSGSVQTKYFYQMGAYSLAVKEMKEHAEVAGVVIVHIPRGKSFDPEKNVYWYHDMTKLEQSWLNILNAYKADQSLQKITDNYSTKTSFKI
jgi:hypothetical protein